MEAEVDEIENVRKSEKLEKQYKGTGRCWMGAGRSGELHFQHKNGQRSKRVTPTALVKCPTRLQHMNASLLKP